MSRPTRLFTAVVAAFLSVGVMPGLAAAGSQPVPEPESPSVDYVFEIEPGEDLDHWIGFALDEADVPSRGRCAFREARDPDCRIVYVYEAAINGVWLRLTPVEARKIDQLEGRQGVRSLTRSWRMTAQWLADDVVVAGSDGRVPAWPDQITPAGVLRVDGGGDLDYSDVHVGVIDSGIDRFHEDLTVVGGFDCTFEGHEDNWGIDSSGHSTHVSGTIGAKDNGRGVKGVAPGASLHSYKVFGQSGGASYAGVLCGVDRAMVDEVDVANMSLGGGNDQSVRDSWDSMHTGIANATDAGIAVVVAAGNDTADAVGKSPANYPEAITVSALATFGSERPGTNPPPFGCADYPQLDNELAWFSNVGAIVDVIAPGVCVLSSLPNNTYGIASGTSMATPHVAGVVAAMVACDGWPDRDSASEMLAYAATYNARWGGDVDYDYEPLAIVPEGC